jgi:hypothetical protein
MMMMMMVMYKDKDEEERFPDSRMCGTGNPIKWGRKWLCRGL